MTLQIRIECQDLPEPTWDGHAQIWIGIQQGKAVVQQRELPAEEIVFEAEVRVEGEDQNLPPNFLGPYCHGTKADRFLYICWGKPSVIGWSGFRRAKLPLGSLTWADIQSGKVMATLNCLDAKGGPICATVKPDHLTWHRTKKAPLDHS